MGLMEDLGRGPAGVDTAILIYFIERASPVSPSGRAVVSCAYRGRIELTTSALTCSQAAMNSILTRSRGVRMVDISRDHLRAAAQLRAASAVKVPDALQLATALTGGCTDLCDQRL
jgi:predicted nucleic acid-binding protein